METTEALKVQDEYGRKFVEIQKWNEEWHEKMKAKVSIAWKFLLVWWVGLLATRGQNTMVAFWAGAILSVIVIGKWLVEDCRHQKEYQSRIDKLEW